MFPFLDGFSFSKNFENENFLLDKLFSVAVHIKKSIHSGMETGVDLVFGLWSLVYPLVYHM